MSAPRTVQAIIRWEGERPERVVMGILDYADLEWPSRDENAEFDSGIYYWLTEDEYASALTNRVSDDFEILEIEVKP
jgi:hypothetical protein